MYKEGRVLILTIKVPGRTLKYTRYTPREHLLVITSEADAFLRRRRITLQIHMAWKLVALLAAVSTVRSQVYCEELLSLVKSLKMTSGICWRRF